MDTAIVSVAGRSIAVRVHDAALDGGELTAQVLHLESQLAELLTHDRVGGVDVESEQLVGGVGVWRLAGERRQRRGDGSIGEGAGRIDEMVERPAERVAAQFVVGGCADGGEPVGVVEHRGEHVRKTVRSCGDEMAPCHERLCSERGLAEHRHAAVECLDEPQPLEVRLVTAVDVEQEPAVGEHGALVVTADERSAAASVRCEVVGDDEPGPDLAEHRSARCEQPLASRFVAAHVDDVELGVGVIAVVIPQRGVAERKVMRLQTLPPVRTHRRRVEVERRADVPGDGQVLREVRLRRLLREQRHRATEQRVIVQPGVAFECDELVRRKEHEDAGSVEHRGVGRGEVGLDSHPGGVRAR